MSRPSFDNRSEICRSSTTRFVEPREKAKTNKTHRCPLQFNVWSRPTGPMPLNRPSSPRVTTRRNRWMVYRPIVIELHPCGAFFSTAISSSGRHWARLCANWSFAIWTWKVIRANRTDSVPKRCSSSPVFFISAERISPPSRWTKMTTIEWSWAFACWTNDFRSPSESSANNVERPWPRC